MRTPDEIRKSLLAHSYDSFMQGKLINFSCPLEGTTLEEEQGAERRELRWLDARGLVTAQLFLGDQDFYRLTSAGRDYFEQYYAGQ